jgi:hypothetical protein
LHCGKSYVTEAGSFREFCDPQENLSLRGYG